MAVTLSAEQLTQEMKARLHDSQNLCIKQVQVNQTSLTLYFISYLIDDTILHRDILAPLANCSTEMEDISQFEKILPVGEIKQVNNIDQACTLLMHGYVYLHQAGQASGFAIKALKKPQRPPSKAEVEGQIYGSHLAFSDALDNNLALMRQFFPTNQLIVNTMSIGTRSTAEIAILHVKELAFEQNVQTLQQRLGNLQVDGILDSSTLMQMIDDNSFSIFPQFLMTERPGRAHALLLEGKIIVLVSGSPFAIVAPCNVLDFLKSADDYFMRWQMASFIRLLRVSAVLLSILFTPTYVAALTFHYELVPSALLVSLAHSRSKVPFPPLFEALLLEVIIELLREAGARLPTKIGQTIGIVGGIVIGTAAVQAGFTSNILIIIVALSTISSFTTPSFMLGTAIRTIRFPMIILAGILGGIGIMVGIIFLLLHLLRQSSLGSPYFYPFYPLRLNDVKDSIIRMSYQFLTKRTSFSRSKDHFKFPFSRGRMGKDNH